MLGRLFCTLALIFTLGVSAASSPNITFTSVVKLVMSRHETFGGCSAFSVNQQERLYLTADHCVRGVHHVFLDGFTATVVAQEKETDLALVRGFLGRRALLPAAADAAEGDKVIAYGYAHGVEMLRVMRVTVVEPSIYVAILDAHTLFVSEPYIKGMSGGPVVNETGEVVSIVQGYVGWPNRDRIPPKGYGRPLGMIKDFLGDRWR